MSGLLSIVVPVFNESEVIKAFHTRLTKVLNGLEMQSEVVFVNDGSTDDTIKILDSLARHDTRLAILDLSRNFGKEIALTAGLDHASGEAVIVIDADLQDPPELIPELIASWKRGYDVVYAQRVKRAGESWFKKTTAAGFYRLMENVSRQPLPRNTGDYRLLSRRAVDAIAQLRERHRFMKGIFTWVGYPQKSVPYERDPRYAGSTKWNYWKLWNLALEGITSFTTAPLRFATFLGIVAALGAFVYGAFIIGRTLWYGVDLPGYPSIMVMILFLGGLQLTALGIIGEYLGRTFDEVKKRPLYLVQRYTPPMKPRHDSSGD